MLAIHTYFENFFGKMNDIKYYEIIWGMFKYAYIERRTDFAANWVVGEADIWTRAREWDHLHYRFSFLKDCIDIKPN